MKKKINKPMRAAGALLVATMLTTCMTAGTFAKYVTTDSATDSARVAKFGVVVNANGYLFGKNYASTNDATNNKPTVDTSGSAVSVASSDTDLLVAPGTQSDTGFGFGVTGKPEVDTEVALTVASAKNVRLNAGAYGVMVNIDDRVTADTFARYKAQEYSLFTSADGATFTQIVDSATYDTNATYYELHDAVQLAADYYPVVYTLAGDTNSASDYSHDSLMAAINAYATAVNGGTATTITSTNTSVRKVYDVNTDLSATSCLGNEVITWAWSFERDGTVKEMYNKADTILGDLICQEKSDTSFKGTVVKTTSTLSAITAAGTSTVTFTKPTLTASNATFDDSTATDANLHTALNITISATQVD